jgi:hypothetical protein
VGRITVELQGRVNDCKAITYRQDIKARDIENYRLRMLPTHQVCNISMFNILSLMLICSFILKKKRLGWEEWVLYLFLFILTSLQKNEILLLLTYLITCLLLSPCSGVML